MSEFHRVLLGLHAQARRIDRDQALLGALGVGAFAYPHQLESVHRIITGTACRWLLADEVGLGKTIQAIMVMRALAAQNSGPLRVALVVPDDLVSQWEEELLCRGHVLALESGDASVETGNLIIRLMRPSVLAVAKKIIPELIDLLLVDEFPRLTVQVRRDLISAARDISNVIVLSATPTLHLAASRQELMSMLEPEADRVARAESRDILSILADREQVAGERYSAELHNSSGRRTVEENFGFYRRLIRTQRSDYPDALPQRVYQPIRLPPTDGDVERGRTTHEYLSAARVADVDIRSDLLLQVSGRSPQSLRERLSTLKRNTPGLQAAWRRIDDCLRNEPGDARLDALIDHVRGVHAKNSAARIVVVAEDNPTTDYLRDALEKLADVKVAKKRRSVSAANELEVHVTTLKDALDDFISGEAKVLVAADAAREGHNLQFAEEIVFFALPWSPPDIQQWIGRIDRLGTKGLPSKRRIAVTPIVVDGSIESRILDVLEGTGVFHRSEVFDDSEWAEISIAINAAAYGVAGATWGDAAIRAKSVGKTYDEWLHATQFPPSQRTNLAREYQSWLRGRDYAAPFNPIDEEARTNWFHIREQAVETLLRLAREEHFEVRKSRSGEQSFFTMWYKVRPGEDTVIFPELDPQSSFFREAYIVRRAAIGCPPCTHIVQSDLRKRRLHFFDHGNVLHDSVVATLERYAPKLDLRAEFVVDFPNGHPILEWENRRLLFAVAEVDTSTMLSFNADSVLGPNDTKLSKPEQDERAAAARRSLSEYQADRRWLLDLCPSELILAAVVEDGNDMVGVDATAALFNPFHGDEVAQQRSKRRSPLPEPTLRAARTSIEAQLKNKAGELLRRAILNVKRETQVRLLAVRADAENLVAAARAELAAAMKLDVKFEFNRAAQRAAQLTLDLAKAGWACRSQRIETAATRFETIVFKSVKLLWVLPCRRQIENESAPR
ncbi:MAG: ATP-dependent helicase HepA [Alphaproteobacteria bacterium]|jgi:hypothetical protein|nr:ATP-dependent helicase HepA [Alphaproteobacteria bacterium]